jgi:hypothetical protein
MSKTKKTTKKTAAKKSTKPTLSKEQLVAIMKRVESGKSGLIAESLALGFNGSKPLHNALTELLGSKEKYNAMLRRAVKARGEKKQPVKNQPVKNQPVKAPVKKTPVQKEPVQKEQPVEAPA